MKTKNIFRTLLIAVGLLMGTVDSLADAWSINFDEITTPDKTSIVISETVATIGGNDFGTLSWGSLDLVETPLRTTDATSEFTIDKDYFSNVNTASKLRVTCKNFDINYWSLGVTGTYQWPNDPEFSNMNAWQSGNSQNAPTDGIFEFNFSAKSVEILKEQGLKVSISNLTVSSVVLLAPEGGAIEPKFVLQTGTTWLLRDGSMGTKGLYSQNSGNRSFGILNCLEGETITINATLNPNPTDNVRLVLKDGDTYSYRVIADGNVAFRPERYIYIHSINITAPPAKFTLTYQLNHSEVYSTYTVYQGDSIPAGGTPVRRGYRFDGWDNGPATMPNYNLTINGTLTKITFAVTYKIGDDVLQVDSVDAGAAIVPPTVEQRAGYTFAWGYYPETMPNYDVVVSGSYQEAVLPTYPIYYQVGDQTVYVEWLKEGDTPNPPASASKTGYTFERWMGVPATMPAESVVASAVFTINSYILTYMVNDEQYGSSEVLEYGTTVTPKTAPEMEGYVFTGWSNLPKTMPAHDVTVTGYFVMEAEKVTATISSSTGYTTFCSNRPLDFTNVTGLKAYIAKSISSTRVQLEQVTGAIAAGTGLILKGETSNIPVAQSEGVTPSNNLLVGVVSKSEKVCSTSKYVLAVINNVATFAATGAYEATVPAGHAYLEAPSSANGARLTIIFPEEEATTDIISVIDTEADDNTIYDLGGHVVTNPKKGCLYIIKGRKTVFK